MAPAMAPACYGATGTAPRPVTPSCQPGAARSLPGALRAGAAAVLSFNCKVHGRPLRHTKLGKHAKQSGAGQGARNTSDSAGGRRRARRARPRRYTSATYFSRPPHTRPHRPPWSPACCLRLANNSERTIMSMDCRAWQWHGRASHSAAFGTREPGGWAGAPVRAAAAWEEASGRGWVLRLCQRERQN